MDTISSTISDVAEDEAAEGSSSILNSVNSESDFTYDSKRASFSRSKNRDNISDSDLIGRLDGHSLEAIVEIKVSRFLDQLGSFYPDNMYDMIMKKVEKPLIKQILLRTGGNQVHASRILGINRNTLRKKMKAFGF